MGARFISANTTFLSNAGLPITAYPFTFAFCAYPPASGTNDFLTLNNGAATYHEVQCDGTLWHFFCQGGGAEVDCTVTQTANAWQFLVVRGISATNRRISVLLPTGASAHAQNTTSRTPTITAFNLGAFSSGVAQADGVIAEFWYTANDIQPGGAQLDEGLLRQLAYNGPFSVPSIAGSLIEYRSFYSSQGSNNDRLGEVYWGGRGRQNWVNNNGVLVGQHPPLLSTYSRPDDAQGLMVI